ncbi:beta-galactosidase [Streptomyces sp. NPDC048577]|uniref:beta-galactosidase n=1 Tax=Streptomyces sp. NPDC048577 TaxID=3157209 RepID=UPI003423CFE3
MPGTNPRVMTALLMSAALAAGCLAGTAAPGSAPAAVAAVTAVSADPALAHDVGYDGYSLMIDGRRTFIWAGEFHYFRLPSPDLWRDVLQKMKAGGFNAVSLYFDWAYHSPSKGVYDFTGVRDVDELLDIADEVGLYVIARPGPYIQAEVDSGGFPAWLGVEPGRGKSTDPDYLAAVDEWFDRINPILARHQLENGTGSVIAYQVENEFYHYTEADRAYVAHLRDKARADGITVPLTGNHIHFNANPANYASYNEGTGALDIDGVDKYPLGFDCEDPDWKPVQDDMAGYRRPGKPLYLPEFQGGSITYWGGSDGDTCREKMGADFASVFYKNNIAAGATLQSLYMLYGGTNWGRQAVSGTYTSYDYGAAITEPRQLTDRYRQNKLIGYFLQSVSPLAKTDAAPAATLTDPAVTGTVRVNPDTATRFHVLRHTDSTSAATAATHMELTTSGRGSGYTHDDSDTDRLRYTGGWRHVGDEMSYTAGEFLRTESFSNRAGDSLTVPFTGTAVRWIGSLAANHGIADVYVDGVRTASVDTYGRPEAKDRVLFAKDGLSPGDHQLKIVVTGAHNPAAIGSFVSVDAVDATGSRAYTTVPQKAGTSITLAGRDSKILVADYRLGDTRLQYSTSEIMTHAQIGGRDVAVLYGRHGQDGETILSLPRRPAVQVLAGDVAHTWDTATGDLRLNYTHTGLARVLVTGGPRPLLLLLGDDRNAETFWRAQTANGPVLVHGGDLLRTATARSGGLDLTGDSSSAQPVEVYANGSAPITWNGAPLATRPGPGGSAAGRLPGPAPVTLPALTGWKHRAGSPEAQPGFDDAAWKVADKTTSHSITKPATLPVLFCDDYGFHYGDVWYRGRFKAGEGTGVDGVTLFAQTGGGGVFSVWLNGTFLGSAGAGPRKFAFPHGVLRTSGDNVVSVLVSNNGHNQNPGTNDYHKEARGLTGAFVSGSPVPTVTWRIQGARGGEGLVDTARGPMNTGGLYGERAGWTLPGFPDGDWSTTGPATRDATPGVSWYRTTAALDLPAGQDTSVGLKIVDDPGRRYRALIYVNGWLLGTYINHRGPQHVFPLPNGILAPHGENTIAIAVGNEDGAGGGLGTVTLENLGTTLSPLDPEPVAGPGYDAATYGMPGERTAALVLDAPDTAAASGTVGVSATFSVPVGRRDVSDVGLGLDLPPGWTAEAVGAVTAAHLAAGDSLTATWNVTAPGGTLPGVTRFTADATYRQEGSTGGRLSDTRIVANPADGLRAPTSDTHVSTLPFLVERNGYGPVERDTSNGGDRAHDGRPLRIGGVPYARGLGAHATSEVLIYLGRRCTRFTATVGVDDEVGDNGSVIFKVWTDSTFRTATPKLVGGQVAATVDVDTTGAELLRLRVEDSDGSIGSDHADWADARVWCS